MTDDSPIVTDGFIEAKIFFVKVSEIFCISNGNSLCNNILQIVGCYSSDTMQLNLIEE